jgi:DNA-binding SARP family transcriptional activator
VVLVRLLGPVKLLTSGRAVDIGPPQRRLVLAALAVDAGRAVPVDTLVDRVWGADAPERGRRALQAHLTRIRGVGPDLNVVRRSGGYLLDLDSDQVDVLRFHRLVREPKERQHLREAIDLWAGEPLAGLSGRWAEQTREIWRQQYLDAVIAWAAAALETGDTDGLIGRLSSLVEAHPLVEPLTAVHMRALHDAGRAAAALHLYAATRRRLVDELGVEPGAELRQAHQAVLRGDGGRATATLRESRPVPAQLPADPPDFAGRGADLENLDALWERHGASLVLAITGTAGVGKPKS